MCTGEVSGNRSSAEPATSVSPIAVPARKPRRLARPAKHRLQGTPAGAGRILAHRAKDQDALAEQADVASSFELGPVDTVAVAKPEMLPRGTAVHCVSREHRVEARIEHDVAAGVREVVRGAEKGDVLPASRRTDAQRVDDVALGARPDALAILVLLEEGMRPPVERRAGRQARPRAVSRLSANSAAARLSPPHVSGNDRRLSFPRGFGIPTFAP